MDISFGFSASRALAAMLMTFGAVASLVDAVDLGTYKGCAATDADFQVVPLAVKPAAGSSDVGAVEPLKLSFAQRANGVVDVFFVEKKGAVKKYDGETKTVNLVGTIACAIGNEDGLTGIAVDPDFQKNRYLYFSYGYIGPADTSFHISRFTVGPDDSLQSSSEKVLVKIPSKRNMPHTGGAMQFDAYGDLWVTVGDNSTTEAGPSNTADMRGGIVRIHPDDKSAKGYTIPKGNFGEYYASKFAAQGNAALAKDYADTAKVKPEIYVKGTRNAYTLSLDPVRRWLSWGDVGPDFGAVSEENNLVQEPHFMGWPYFAGKLDLTNSYGFTYAKHDRNAPVNTATTTGVHQLPANQEPIYPRQQNCAMNGPIFRYDGANSYPGQIPPQLNRKWLVGDCNGSYGYHLLTLNDKGDSVVNDVKAFDLLHVAVLVDLQQGPDGAIYYVGWQGGVYRADYKGACKDAALLAEKTGCADPTDANFDPKLNPAFNDPRLCAKATAVRGSDGRARGISSGRSMPGRFIFEAGNLSVESEGRHELRLMDVHGRTVFSAAGEGPKSYAWPASVKPGLYHVILVTADGIFTERLMRLEK